MMFVMTAPWWPRDLVAPRKNARLCEGKYSEVMREQQAQARIRCSEHGDFSINDGILYIYIIYI